MLPIEFMNVHVKKARFGANLLAGGLGVVLNCMTATAAVTDAVPGVGGDTWSQIPFSGVTLTDVPPMRLQQVYDAFALQRTMPEGGWITGMWFVSDSTVGRNWTAGLPKVEISMGLTSRRVDDLSPNFADNFSGAPVEVRPLGSLSVTSDGPGSVVQINFINPSFYDPSAGNLLLEIKNYLPTASPGVPQANAGPLDAWNVTGDAVSRVYARGDANATIGTVDTIGLTTLFVFTPVPEPSVLALVGLGLGALGWRWARRESR